MAVFDKSKVIVDAATNLHAVPDRCAPCLEKLFLNSGSSDPEFTVSTGTQMKVEHVNRDWSRHHAPLLRRDLFLPTQEQRDKSLFMPREGMDQMRQYAAFRCHDLRLATMRADGEIVLAFCKRVEPNKESEKLRTPDMSPFSVVETAPINGFLWPIGGRVAYAKPGSPLDGKFNLFHSAVLKAHAEAGIATKNIIGIYNLGIGTTDFSTSMTYHAYGRGEEGVLLHRARDISMPLPQNTINTNLIILLNPKDLKLNGDSSVEKLTWLSRREFEAAADRFCSYEQQFIAAFFQGWEDFRSARGKIQTLDGQRSFEEMNFSTN